MPLALSNPGNYVQTVLLWRQRQLPLVAFQVAIPARSGNILRRIISTIRSGVKMLRSALEQLCLSQRVVVSLGKRFDTV